MLVAKSICMQFDKHCYIDRKVREYKHTYLVFSIFKNCKISENCINLKALKNLKPARKKKTTKKSVKHD